MNNDPDIKAHKSFANEHSFGVWFLFQIWNAHSLWFWTTNPPWSGIIQVRSSVVPTPLFNGRIFAPAGFRPRGRNPRRHPNVPRVKKKYRIVLLVVYETFPIWWNWARTVVPVNFQHVRGSAIAQTGFVNESHSPYCVAHKHNKWRTRNRGVEGTSMSTAKATPTTTDRGTGDWNQRNYDGFTLSKTQIS